MKASPARGSDRKDDAAGLSHSACLAAAEICPSVEQKLADPVPSPPHPLRKASGARPTPQRLRRFPAVDLKQLEFISLQNAAGWFNHEAPDEVRRQGRALARRQAVAEETQTNQQPPVPQHASHLTPALPEDGPAVLLSGAPPFRVVDVNELWLHAFGFAHEEVVGETIGVVQGSLTEIDAVSELMAACRLARPHSAVLTNYTKSGAAICNRLVVTPHFTPGSGSWPGCDFFLARSEITPIQSLPQCVDLTAAGAGAGAAAACPVAAHQHSRDKDTRVATTHALAAIDHALRGTPIKVSHVIGCGAFGVKILLTSTRDESYIPVQMYCSVRFLSVQVE